MRYKTVCEKGFLYENNLKMKQIIEMLDDWNLRFLPITKHTDVALSGMGDSEELEQVSMNYVLLEFEVVEDGGRTCAFNNIQFKIFYLLYSYKFLLESLSVLNESNILHMGINDASIYWNNKTVDDLMFYSKNILISNFSKSLYQPSIKGIYNLLEEDEDGLMYRSEVAVELKLMCYVKLKSIHVLSESMIKDFVDKYINVEGVIGYKELCVAYLIDAYCDEVVNVEDMFKYYDTWDTYALSILYLAKTVEIMKSVDTEHPILSSLFQILNSNISPDPMKRLNFACVLI